jgi:hypothetical protein
MAKAAGGVDIGAWNDTVKNYSISAGALVTAPIYAPLTAERLPDYLLFFEMRAFVDNPFRACR